MKKLSDFLVDKRFFVFLFMILLMILCIILGNYVNINFDLTEYLPDNSNMKMGLDIMNSEFQENMDSKTFKIMFKNLDNAEIDDILKALSEFDGVSKVEYEVTDKYNKDGYTLFILTTSLIDISDIAECVDGIVEYYQKDYTVYSYYKYSQDKILSIIVPIALVVILVVLFIMCNSLLEPLLILLSIGIAVILNNGSNIIFHNISGITNYIAATIQAILSIDYSIIILHRYFQEKELLASHDKVQAMKNALHSSSKSVLGSSVTTIFGLLALALMSFKLGADMGFVLAKGIVCSLICAFTVLPAVTLYLDKFIEYTNKKAILNKLSIRLSENKILEKSMRSIGNFACRFKKSICIIFVIVFVFSGILQTRISIDFANKYLTKTFVNDIFPEEKTLVILYNNDDESAAERVAENLATYDNVLDVKSYSHTLEKEISADEISNISGLDSLVVRMLIYAYKNGFDPSEISVVNFVKFLSSDEFLENKSLSGFLNQEVKDFILNNHKIVNNIYNDTQYDDNALSELFDIELQKVKLLLLIEDRETMSIKDFTDCLHDMYSKYPSNFTDEQSEKLIRMKMLCESIAANETVTCEEFVNMLPYKIESLNDYVPALYMLCNSSLKINENETVILYDFIMFVNNAVENPIFKSVITDSTKASVKELISMATQGKAELVGKDYSRIVVSFDYQSENGDYREFYEPISQITDKYFEHDYYFIGDTAMAYELSQSFQFDYNIISIAIALAIFAIIAISFKNIFIPAILVSLIECAVFVSLSIQSLLGSSVYYIAIFFVQGVLMGAAVDYGILLTNYYVDLRESMDKNEAVSNALLRASRAIFTSGFVILFVVFIIGAIVRGALGDILIAVGCGALSALLLVIFVLPSLLVLFDKFIIKDQKH